MFEIELVMCIKMDLALNNRQLLTCHKTQTTNQQGNLIRETTKVFSSLIRFLEQSFVSISFSVLLRTPSLLFLSSPFVWWYLHLIFKVIYSFLLVQVFWFFSDWTVLFLQQYVFFFLFHYDHSAFFSNKSYIRFSGFSFFFSFLIKKKSIYPPWTKGCLSFIVTWWICCRHYIVFVYNLDASLQLQIVVKKIGLKQLLVLFSIFPNLSWWRLQLAQRFLTFSDMLL